MRRVGADIGPAAGNDESTFTRRYALDFFRDVASSSQWFAAVPKRADVARGGIRSLSSYLDPSMARNLLSVADNTGDEELIFEDPGCAAGTDSFDPPPSGKEPVFVRVEHFHPSILRRCVGDLCEGFQEKK